MNTIQSIPIKTGFLQRIVRYMRWEKNKHNHKKIHKNKHKKERKNALYILLFGCPASGKTNLCSKLEPQLLIPHLSIGSMFRREIQDGTPLGERVKPYINSGALVPDAITCLALRDELAKPEYFRGAILDGFPRTRKQAKYLDKLLSGYGNRIRHLIFLDVPEKDCLERLHHRRDKLAKAALSITKPSEQDGVETITQRDDHSDQALKVRLETFKKESLPLIDYYKRKGILIHILSTNDKAKSAVLSEVLVAIKRFGQKISYKSDTAFQAAQPI